jgi:hypothetical protein
MANSRLCSIPDCSKPAFQCGYCRSHHRRYWRYGDPLAGSTYLGAPSRFIEEAIRTSDKENCIRWPFRTGRGYGLFVLNGRTKAVHRYVCERVHGAPPSETHEAAHTCGEGRRGCINPHHLAWKTPQENAADKLKHDTHLRGERNVRAKLTEESVLEIRKLYCGGDKSAIELGAQYGVSATAIYLIGKGKNWGWLKD